MQSPVKETTAAETVIWSAREGQFAHFSFYFLGTLLFWLIVPIFLMAWRWITTSCHRYELTEERLRERTGVFNVQWQELELYRVKDIEILEPFIQRVIGCGIIELTTSDRNSTYVHLNCIEDPRNVANLLRQKVERCREKKGVREFD